MKAAVYYANGDPSVLKYEEVPDPAIGPDEVLIAVEAISIEGGDVLTRETVPPPFAPFVVGFQAAGTVVAIGEAVRTLRVGQRVAAFHWQGSHAELFVASADLAYPIPDGLDARVAATAPVAFGTADDALFDAGALTAGQTVLITGATGGVGIAAVQLAKAAGVRVIGTASTNERIERLRALGLDDGINYKTTDVASRALELTSGRGVDVVVDLAGGDGAVALTRAIRRRGRFVVVGAASGMPSFGFDDIITRSLTFVGVYFGHDMALPRVHAMVKRHLLALAHGTLRMPIDRTFALSDAAAAHTHVQQGHPFGRVVILP